MATQGVSGGQQQWQPWGPDVLQSAAYVCGWFMPWFWFWVHVHILLGGSGAQMGLGTSEALGTWKFEVNEIWKFVGLGYWQDHWKL